MALDGFTAFEHSLPVELQKDVVELVAQSKTFYTPTILVAYGAPWAENYWYEASDLLKDEKLKRVTPWSDLEGKLLRRGGSTGAVTTGAAAGWFHESQYAMKGIGQSIRDLIAAGILIGRA